MKKQAQDSRQDLFLAIQGYGRPPRSANLLDLDSGQAFRGHKARVLQVSERHGSFNRKRCLELSLNMSSVLGTVTAKCFFQVSRVIQILILSVLPAGYTSGFPGPITDFGSKQKFIKICSCESTELPRPP